MSIFPNDINAVSVFDSLKDAFSKYVVTPANAFGIGGFVFDVEGDSTANLGTEITDHYTEGNFAVQDHISVKPKKFILKQYVGELVYRLDDNTNTLLQKTIQKLTVLDSYLPQLSAGVNQVKTYLDGGQLDLSFSDILNDSVNIWGIAKNLNPPIPRQQQAYQFFKALMEQKILVSVQTPFEYTSNMAIEAITASQPEGSRYISDFTIVLKEIRVVKTKNSAFEFIVDKQPKNGIQSSELLNGGKTQGVPVPVDSILSGWVL